MTEVSNTLACEKTEAAKRHADKQAQLMALQQEIRHLHAETEALQQEKLDCAKNKEQMENKPKYEAVHDGGEVKAPTAVEIPTIF